VERPEVVSAGYGPDVLEAVLVDAKYEGYLAKQARVVVLQRKLDGQKIPDDLDYADVEHLRIEARERLSTFRPATLGHASRLAGITPADVTVLRIHLRKHGGRSNFEPAGD